ncbi:hypothetical protein AVEN_26956-1 [Araneus ventricosus]|uniref:Uncharacterized protein n=1 Tax=Araneus ventricosus TaxID=182803 RepID=A0A4Y2VWQ3_ARAVE|nr:hypothetical protein AVEN_26956-1 [Araneus ventricosus]
MTHCLTPLSGRTPSIYNDSMIYVHLIMKVSALPVNKESTRLTPTVRVGTQGKPEHDVKVPGLEIKKKVGLSEIFISCFC